MVHIDDVLFTFGMFAILMVAFGQTIPNADVQNSINTIFGNWPTLAQSTQPIPKCNTLDIGCQANAGIAQATAFIAVPFLWMGALVSSGLARISAFGGLIGFVTFGSASAFGTVPFGNLFLLALFIIVAVGLFRLFRGSPSGL